METKNISQYLGAFCRAKRKEQKMSVRVLSELTGIHTGAIIKFELGQVDTRLNTFLKIIDALRIKIEDIATIISVHK